MGRCWSLINKNVKTIDMYLKQEDEIIKINNKLYIVTSDL